MNSAYQHALACLQASDPAGKVALSLRAAAEFAACGAALPALPAALAPDNPGRPARPLLVHFSKLPRRRLTTKDGRGAFLHALAHIEFTAINLAWDAVCRFPGMPAQFYLDWSRVAGEEAQHFSLLAERLRQLDFSYGDFPAHDGLWEMAQKTAHDALVRLALVPRVLEARGLDVTPGMIGRLQEAGDSASAAILERILVDEIGHVEAGTRWFRYLCAQRGLEPLATFRGLLRQFMPAAVRKPLNMSARRLAGFDRDELELLEQWPVT